MRGKIYGGWIIAAAISFTAAPATAQGGLASKIEIEKMVTAADGQPPVKTYVEPEVVIPGDRVRITLTFANGSTAPASGVNVVNPIPEGLIFDGTADTNGFAVSVDGGKSFGSMAALTVPVANGTPRAATAADVTHVRWLWPDALPAGQKRSVAFFGRVK